MAGPLLASVWCLLLLGAALRAPVVVAYLACVALLWWTRPHSSARPAPLADLLAGASGFVALPAWLALVVACGDALGLARPAPVAPPAAWLADVALAPPATWVADVALAPLFEEWLYRERLLPALRARLGAPLALVLSSAAFAAPHLGVWSVLTTFAVGLALGGVFLASGRVGLCVAAHAGLNAGALVCGLPPRRWALPPEWAALAGGVLLALALVSTRVHAAPPAPRRARPR